MIVTLKGQPDPSTPAPHSHADGPNTCSILVVDDERPIVDLLQDVLESEGYTVQHAFDGDEAMGILRRTNPHLIITDIMMPRAGGRELLEFIDQRSNQSSPKVIFMSALDPPAEWTMHPFIEKPFDIDDLLDLVDSALAPNAR